MFEIYKFWWRVCNFTTTNLHSTHHSAHFSYFSTCLKSSFRICTKLLSNFLRQHWSSTCHSLVIIWQMRARFNILFSEELNLSFMMMYRQYISKIKETLRNKSVVLKALSLGFMLRECSNIFFLENILNGTLKPRGGVFFLKEHKLLWA